MKKGTYRDGQEQLELRVSLGWPATQTARFMFILTGFCLDEVTDKIHS